MTFLEVISLIFSAGCIFLLIQGIGKRIVIQETIAAYACINYLVMPFIAYHVFNKRNDLAVLWETVMPISSSTYFRILLPAMIGLTLGLFWPLRSRGLKDSQLLANVKLYLDRKSFLGYVFIVLGTLFGFFYKLVPPGLSAIFYFGSQLLYIGLFYLLFSRPHYKWLILLFGITMLILQSIRTAMYGELIFWTFFALIYLMIGSGRYKLIPKLVLMIFGFLSILLIQSIKHEYREEGPDADASYFFSLISERILQPSTIFEPDKMFSAVTRGNQGFLMARTIHYVPKREPYAKGETIIKSIAASVVPRIVWKDKPALGGQENTCRFLGDCSKRTYSYNIGQIGEGYANFGPLWNVLYLFFYGLFVNWSLGVIKQVSLKRPSVLLWIPLLFFAGLSLETDLLTFLNTLLKGVIFTALVYGIFRFVLKWRI